MINLLRALLQTGRNRDKFSKILADQRQVESGGANKDVIEWIWSERLPFFFRSQLYGEYKVSH